MIKKPDDKSRFIIPIVIVAGIVIKFFEITMESILIENNSILIVSYLSPIIIFVSIISILFIKINFLKEKFKR